VLELVDNPRDLKFEMAARATGWDVLSSRIKTGREGKGTTTPRAMVETGVKDVEETIERERVRALSDAQGEAELRLRTRWNLRKALRYRSSEDVKRFGDKVQEHMVRSDRRRGPQPPQGWVGEGSLGAHRMTLIPHTDTDLPL
jgi:large subunit ribosomal protein L17